MNKKPTAWKVLADEDKPDNSRLIDVILYNGDALTDREYNNIDWTQVSDWRYSDVAAPDLNVETEPRRLTDEQIEEFCKSRGARWNGDYWIIEDADLHPLIRAVGSAAPVAARELDVEAERREFEAAYVAYLQECYGQRPIPEDDLAGHFERSGHYPDKYVRCQAEWRGWLWHAAVGAAQSTAQVSTEQAGDAWRLVPINPTPEMLSAARNAPLPMVALDSMSAQQDLMNKSRYTAMLGAAPSPNNSPAGADRRE